MFCPWKANGEAKASRNALRERDARPRTRGSGQYHKFIAAEAREKILRAQTRLQSRRDGLDELVAGIVA